MVFDELRHGQSCAPHIGFPARLHPLLCHCRWAAHMRTHTLAGYAQRSDKDGKLYFSGLIATTDGKEVGWL